MDVGDRDIQVLDETELSRSAVAAKLDAFLEKNGKH